VPLGVLLKDHWRGLLAGSAGVVACFALFYLSTAFALAQGRGLWAMGGRIFWRCSLPPICS
jgi:hypothetical protein